MESHRSAVGWLTPTSRAKDGFKHARQHLHGFFSVSFYTEQHPISADLIFNIIVDEAPKISTC